MSDDLARALAELRAAVKEAAAFSWPPGSPEQKFVRAMQAALDRYDRDEAADLQNDEGGRS